MKAEWRPVSMRRIGVVGSASAARTLLAPNSSASTTRLTRSVISWIDLHAEEEAQVLVTLGSDDVVERLRQLEKRLPPVLHSAEADAEAGRRSVFMCHLVHRVAPAHAAPVVEL